MSRVPLVVIETPLRGVSGDYDPAHVEYLRRAMRDSMTRGEAPFAGHALYAVTGVLDDKNPMERSLGISLSAAWTQKADLTVVYYDYEISDGMRSGIDDAEDCDRPVEYRSIGKNP